MIIPMTTAMITIVNSITIIIRHRYRHHHHFYSFYLDITTTILNVITHQASVAPTQPSRSVLQVPWARKASTCRRRCFPFPSRPPSPTCLPFPTWTVLIPSATLSSLALSPRPSHRRSATDRPNWPSAIIGDGGSVRMRDAPRRRTEPRIAASS